MSNRRQFLKFAMAGAAIASTNSLLSREVTSRNLSQPFVIPPLDLGTRKGNKVFFDLTLRRGLSHFFPGVATPTLGINGHYLGPTLRVSRGDHATLKVNNRISHTSVLHWHGFTLPAIADGGPHQEIPSGSSRSSVFEVRQPAATLWYHSHQMHETGDQVYRGLGGMFLVDDKYSQSLPTPNEYGVDDIPVILQDRNFHANGELRYITQPMERMMGIHGEVMLVNGAYRPRLQAQKTLLRFRILNASNARSYRIALSDGRAFQMIAADCGFLPEPVRLTELSLSPGERAEILVNLSDRQPVALISRGNAGKSYSTMSAFSGNAMKFIGMNHPMHLFWIDPTQAETSSYNMLTKSLLPMKWPEEPLLATRPMALDMGPMGMGRRGMHRIREALSGNIGHNLMRNMNSEDIMRGNFTINDRSMDMRRIDFRVKKDSTEVWVIRNSSMMMHPFHVHSTQFTILDRNGRPPMPIERGLKDTVMVNPGEEVRILIPFRYYSDSTTPYMYHCHILEHEDGGMMGQFVVDA